MNRLFKLQKALLSEIDKYEKLVSTKRDQPIEWERIHMASCAKLGYLMGEKRGIDPILAAAACAISSTATAPRAISSSSIMSTAAPGCPAATAARPSASCAKASAPPFTAPLARNSLLSLFEANSQAFCFASINRRYFCCSASLVSGWSGLRGMQSTGQTETH